jgi:hypothetical protein
MDAIHDALVLEWIKQSDISFPHMQSGEPSVCGSLSQNSAGVFVPLDCDNWLVSKDKVGKQSASNARE